MASVASIVAGLGDVSSPLQRRDLRKLNDIGHDARDEFRAAWERVELERRREIATALAALAEENVEFDFRDVFGVLVEDPEAGVRLAAVDGLWEDDRVVTLRQLLPMLDGDHDEDVRAAVALALGRFAQRAGLGELPDRVAGDIREVLHTTASNLDTPDEVRRRAIEGMGYFGGEDTTVLIGQAYTSGKRPLKESAIVAMGHTLDPRWLPVLDAELRSNVAPMLYEAARASGEFGSEAMSLLPPLLPLAESDDLEVAQAAVWALGQIGGESARRVLKRLAGSTNPTIVQAAEEALAELQMDAGSFGLSG